MTKRKKDKRKINDLQSITQKIKDRATRTPLKARDKLRCSGRVGISWSTCGTRRVTLATNRVISRELWLLLRQTVHICGILWHRYSVAVNQVMVATVKLSKLGFQFNY